MFTEQFMRSPDSHLFKNEGETLMNVYFENAGFKSHVSLLQVLLFAGIPPSLYKMEIFPFLFLTSSQDLLFLDLTMMASTAPREEIPGGLVSVPSSCHPSR